MGRRQWDFRRSAIGARHMVDVGAAHGVPHRLLLAGSGLRATDLARSDTAVEAGQELAVARNLVQTLGDSPGLGVEVARRFTLNSFDLLGFAMMSSATAGEAMAVALRVMRVGNQFVDTSLRLAPTSGRIEFDDEPIPSEIRQFLVERDLVVIFGVLVLPCLGAEILGRLPEAQLELSTSTERAVVIADAIADAVGPDPGQQLPVFGGRRKTALTFPADFLDAPMAMPNPDAAAICEHHCLQCLEQRKRYGVLASQVRAQLLRRVAEGPTAASIAAEMSFDRRTLHRKLEAEGTSFRAIHDEVRSALAIEMLADLNLTTHEVAQRLGYSGSEAFSRAFRRWAGCSPSAYRARSAQQ